MLKFAVLISLLFCIVRGIETGEICWGCFFQQSINSCEFNEYKNILIECPAGQRFVITEVFYGQKRGTTSCREEFSIEPFGGSDCSIPTSVAISAFQKACDGKDSQCIIRFEEDFFNEIVGFEDPCSGTRQFTSVTYECQPPPRPESTLKLIPEPMSEPDPEPAQEPAPEPEPIAEPSPKPTPKPTPKPSSVLDPKLPPRPYQEQDKTVEAEANATDNSNNTYSGFLVSVIAGSAIGILLILLFALYKKRREKTLLDRQVERFTKERDSTTGVFDDFPVEETTTESDATNASASNDPKLLFTPDEKVRVAAARVTGQPFKQTDKRFKKTNVSLDASGTSNEKSSTVSLPFEQNDVSFKNVNDSLDACEKTAEFVSSRRRPLSTQSQVRAPHYRSSKVSTASQMSFTYTDSLVDRHSGALEDDLEEETTTGRHSSSNQSQVKAPNSRSSKVSATSQDRHLEALDDMSVEETTTESEDPQTSRSSHYESVVIVAAPLMEEPVEPSDGRSKAAGKGLEVPRRSSESSTKSESPQRPPPSIQSQVHEEGPRSSNESAGSSQVHHSFLNRLVDRFTKKQERTIALTTSIREDDHEKRTPIDPDLLITPDEMVIVAAPPMEPFERSDLSFKQAKDRLEVTKRTSQSTGKLESPRRPPPSTQSQVNAPHSLISNDSAASRNPSSLNGSQKNNSSFSFYDTSNVSIVITPSPFGGDRLQSPTGHRNNDQRDDRAGIL